MRLDNQTPNLHIRSDLKAGAVLCYQDVNGYLVPLNYPYVPPEQNLPQLPAASGPWLTCNSCSGTHAGEGRLTDASCEVCSY